MGRFSRKRFSRAAHGGSEDFDLNITPIIDCFTVLIAFVLVSASFVSISFMESEVSAASASALKESGLNVAITIGPDRSILVDVSGQDGKQAVHRSHRIPAREAKRVEPDYDQFSDRLVLLKGEWPNLNTAVLSADSAVAYSDVIKSMEIARKAFSSVSLGGF